MCNIEALVGVIAIHNVCNRGVDQSSSVKASYTYMRLTGRRETVGFCGYGQGYISVLPAERIRYTDCNTSENTVGEEYRPLVEAGVKHKRNTWSREMPFG